MDLVERVTSALRYTSARITFDLPSQAIVVGVSGGPDSLTLLHILAQLVPVENLIVAHLDHGLRPDSAAESDFVAGIAKHYRYHTQRIDVGSYAREQKISLEEAGRIVRYDFLARVARIEGAAFVATGHNADDQVETVLLHVLRGSGTGGLRGMQVVAPLPGHAGLWLIRPLLGISRAEIEAYCAQHDLEPVHDESNTDITFLRNRLRYELLPILEGYNPQVRQRLREMAEIIAGDDDLLFALTDQAWDDAILRKGDSTLTIRRMVWEGLPTALRRRLLRRAIGELQPGLRDLSFQALEAGRLLADKGQAGSRSSLPGGLILTVTYDTLLITAAGANLTIGYPQTLTDDATDLAVPGSVGLKGGWRIEAELVEMVDEHEIREISDSWTVYISADSATGLHVRPRSTGERMRPFGLGGEAKLKKIMIDRKIPVYLRDRWPIVALPDRIVWLPGHLLDERARVPAGSARAIRLRCRGREKAG